MSETKIKTVQMPVTPALALTWLENNTHNRDLSQGQVNKYARDMAMGRWKITHQGIAIADNGVVIDGQHRLWAIIESKTTVILQVTTGLPLSTQEAIDGGLMRSARDVVALRDGGQVKLQSLHMGIARLLCKQLTGNDAPTRQEVVDCFDVHRDNILQAVGMFPYAARYIRTSTVGTVIVRAIYSEVPAEVARFVQILGNGVRADSDEPQRRDDNALLLRRYLLGESDASRRVRPTVTDIYFKTERALRAYLDEDRLNTLYAASFEMFRIPGELFKAPAKKATQIREKRRMQLKDAAERKQRPDGVITRKRVPA